jgi:hypothetical protein
VKADFSGFPSDTINVAVCRNDIPLQEQQGPSDCADFPGTASTIPTSVKGKGTTQIVLPASIDVRDVAAPGSSNGTVIDCTVPGNCTLIAATFSGPFAVATADLNYASIT